MGVAWSAITCVGVSFLSSVTLRMTNQISQILVEDFLGNGNSESSDMIFFNPNASHLVTVTKGTFISVHTG